METIGVNRSLGSHRPLKHFPSSVQNTPYMYNFISLSSDFQPLKMRKKLFVAVQTHGNASYGCRL